jgi:hypothetical protein
MNKEGKKYRLYLTQSEVLTCNVRLVPVENLLNGCFGLAVDFST